MTEKKLNQVIDKCLKGNRSGQQQLYEYTYTSLAAVVSLYTKDSSERDWVFNTAMLKLFGSLSKYEKGTNYLGWARTILVFTAIDHYRKTSSKSAVNVSLEQVSHNANHAELNQALVNLEVEVIVDCIQKLPKKEQTVFNLAAIEGYTHKEIEELTEINQNTSKWLLNKAKNSLKKLLHNLPEKKYV